MTSTEREFLNTEILNQLGLTMASIPKLFEFVEKEAQGRYERLLSLISILHDSVENRRESEANAQEQWFLALASDNKAHEAFEIRADAILARLLEAQEAVAKELAAQREEHQLRLGDFEHNLANALAQWEMRENKRHEHALAKLDVVQDGVERRYNLIDNDLQCIRHEQNAAQEAVLARLGEMKPLTTLQFAGWADGIVATLNMHTQHIATIERMIQSYAKATQLHTTMELKAARRGQRRKGSKRDGKRKGAA
jgi:hypothetical protein